MNWNLFADQVLRKGEQAFRDTCTEAGVNADAIIAVEEARQAEARMEEVAEALKAEGIDVAELTMRIAAKKAAAEALEAEK